MAWGTAPSKEEQVQPPESLTEDRIRQIVREELNIIAVQGFTAAKDLTHDA